MVLKTTATLIFFTIEMLWDLHVKQQMDIFRLSLFMIITDSSPRDAKRARERAITPRRCGWLRLPGVGAHAARDAISPLFITVGCARSTPHDTRCFFVFVSPSELTHSLCSNKNERSIFDHCFVMKKLYTFHLCIHTIKN